MQAVMQMQALNDDDDMTVVKPSKKKKPLKKVKSDKSGQGCNKELQERF